MPIKCLMGELEVNCSVRQRGVGLRLAGVSLGAMVCSPDLLRIKFQQRITSQGLDNDWEAVLAGGWHAR